MQDKFTKSILSPRVSTAQDTDFNSSKPISGLERDLDDDLHHKKSFMNFKIEKNKLNT